MIMLKASSLQDKRFQCDEDMIFIQLQLALEFNEKKWTELKRLNDKSAKDPLRLDDRGFNY